MSSFINFSELYGSGGTFDRQVVEFSSKDSTTTIWGGYCPLDDPTDPNIETALWIIRKLVVVEDGGTQTIECTWARAPWNRRDNPSTVYTYHKPATPNMYAEPQPPLDPNPPV